MRIIHLFSALALVILSSNAMAGNRIYKCVTPDERIVYADKKCNPGERTFDSKELNEINAANYNQATFSEIKPGTIKSDVSLSPPVNMDLSKLPPLPPIPPDEIISEIKKSRVK